MEKTNYFYIDEAGNLLNNSNVFVHGCIKTDSPKTIENAMTELKSELYDNLYYEEFRDRIYKEGFHATENHPDMRADFYKLLPLLEYRAYFVLINKESEYFRNLSKRLAEHEIFKMSLESLLMDRIKSHHGDRNIFVFEQITIQKKSLRRILEEIFNSLDETHYCSFEIVDKSEENLGAVDYLNFIFYNLFTLKENQMERVKQNFNIVAPKIAIIKLLHNKVYLSRKKKPNYKVTLENLRREFSG